MTTFTLDAQIVGDAQSRLTNLGLDCASDPVGVCAEKTTRALETFQRLRGLRVTGELDAVTWHRLLEAQWRMGDRLLFLCRPALRGDDVASLQEALAMLGFNPGRIDGIFGVLTERALADFQRNCGVEPSGVLNRSALHELNRLSFRSSHRRPVTETRDSAPAIYAPQSLVAVHGDGPVASGVAEHLASSVSVVCTCSRDDHEGAAQANASSASLLLSFRESAEATPLIISYFASYRSHSVVGRQLADAIATALEDRVPYHVVVSGMAVPILRETMMPSLAFSLGALDGVSLSALIDAVSVSVTALFTNVQVAL